MMANVRGDLEWWQTRRFVVAMALLAMVPLVWPNIPPLVDLPGHMGRYRVQLDLHTYPWLTDWYDFHWQLIGNLGIDILVQIFAPLLGLELTVKLIVMAIPALVALFRIDPGEIASAMERITRRISTIWGGSRPLVGSSRISSSGRPSMAWAMASRWRMPWL